MKKQIELQKLMTMRSAMEADNQIKIHAGKAPAYNFFDFVNLYKLMEELQQGETEEEKAVTIPAAPAKMSHVQMEKLAENIARDIDEGYGWSDIDGILRCIDEVEKVNTFDQGWICAIISRMISVVDCASCTEENENCESCPIIFPDTEEEVTRITKLKYGDECPECFGLLADACCTECKFCQSYSTKNEKVNCSFYRDSKDS